jgi:hypothetical protein
MRRLLACAAMCALVVAGCSGSSGHHAASTSGSSSSASTEVPTGTTGFRLIASRSTVISAGPPAHVSTAVTKAVDTLVRNYVVLGSVDALRTGKLGKGFSALFGSDAVGRIAHPGNDRNTLTDLSGPRGSGSVHVRGALHLTGLGDQNGNIVMLSAAFNTTLRRGTLAIDRAGELLIARGGGGRWTIIGYNVRARRSVGTAPATTTTAVTHGATTGSTP